MAQLTQADQLSPIQATVPDLNPIGRERITGNGAAELAIKLGDTLDTAGKAYSDEKAKSIVTEEIENIDKARAFAEKGVETVPAGLDVDQKEYDILSNAVASGEMSREKARLIASSRIRTRISEQPFYADRMRKAASGVLGFNIESEGARQYFASFDTQAQIDAGNSPNKKIADMQAMAAEESRITGIPADKIYRQMWALETAGRNKEQAEADKAAGLINDQQQFTIMNTENAKTAFTGVVGDLKAIYDEEGAVKPEVYTRALADAEAQEMQELSQVWKGAQTDPAYARAQSVIAQRYEGYQTVMEAVDYDKLNKIIIDRNQNERTLFTDKMFADVKMINDVAGQAGVTAYFDSMSSDLNETQRRQLFKQFPILGRLHSLANASPGELSERLNTTSRKMLTGEPLDEGDKELVDPVVTKIHETGNEEVQDGLLARLVEEGMPYKMMSVMAAKRPGKSSTQGVADFKRRYNEELPGMMTNLARQVEQLGRETNRFGEPVVELEIGEDGTVSVNSLRPMSLPQGKLNELRNAASHINQFSKAQKNGWGTVFGEGRQEYQVKLARFADEGKGQASRIINATTQDTFVKQVNQGNEGRARDLYEQISSENPDAFTTPFDQIYAEIRRRTVERLEGERRGE